jgi:hypothetical protein
MFDASRSAASTIFYNCTCGLTLGSGEPRRR